MKKIVIVEDEPFMREELADLFREAGYPVACVADFENAREQILSEGPGLVVLDLNLPGVSGFQLCRALKRQAGFPVLVLTSRDQLRDELRALELGADEYLTKPCRKERLLARVENLLRRYEGRAHLLEGPGFLLDRQTYTLYMHERSVVLPRNQGRILETLLRDPGELVSKDELSMALWETTEYIDENALQVNLTRLKKTMREMGMELRVEAVRGQGYRLVDGENNNEA